MKLRLPSKNDEPSHEIPSMQMIAVIPLRMIVPFNAASGDALKTTMISPAIAIMTIMIAIPMLT